MKRDMIKRKVNLSSRGVYIFLVCLLILPFSFAEIKNDCYSGKPSINKWVESLTDKLSGFIIFLDKDFQGMLSEYMITIINPQSYPKINEEWIVMFGTEGIADLKIGPVNGTDWEQIEFIELKCGNDKVNHSLLGDYIFVKDYSCDKTSYEISKVLKSGKHTLEFDFGGVKAYAHNAAEWSDSSFDRCINITLTNTGATTLVDFPVYINLTYDDDMLSDFSDLRFYNASCNDGGVLLDYEIENYTDDNANIWVRIPSLTSPNKMISVYYKNTTAVDSGENASGVWDSDFVMVQHLQESSGTHFDSTRYGNNGTYSDGKQGEVGIIDGADNFDNTDDNIDTGAESSLIDVTNGTIEVWFSSTNDDYNTLVSVGDTNANSFCEFVSGDGTTGTLTNELFGIQTNPSGGADNRIGYTSATRTEVYDGAWHHLVVTADNAYKLYLDGVSKTVSVGGGNNDGEFFGDMTGMDNSRIGCTNKNSEGNIRPTGGILDEVRVSKITRSAEWINQSYQIVENHADHVSYGNEENQPATDTCTHTSGNWDVEGSDNCTISSAVDLDDNDFSCTGTGVFNVEADITNYGTAHFGGGCVLHCSGGCFT